jgi:hypothetical protein
MFFISTFSVCCLEKDIWITYGQRAEVSKFQIDCPYVFLQFSSKQLCSISKSLG